MPIMSKPSSAPRTALTFITIGSLLTIWSTVWYFNSAERSRTVSIIIMGLFWTGVAFLVIGFSVGYISRSARHAELPPSEVTGAVARNEAAATANHQGNSIPATPPPAPGIPGTPYTGVPPTTVVQTGPGGANP